MSRKTITRPQAEALRTAELYDGEVPPSGTPLAGHHLISARSVTVAVLIRLGLAEVITVKSAGESYDFPVLTRAGELIAVTLTAGGDLPSLDTVAYYVANAETRPNDGTYRPARAGARGVRDAVPLWLDGKHVTAGVEGNGTRLYVFLGTEMIYGGDMPSGIKITADVNPWVRQYATGYVWAAEYRTLWSYRDHAGHVWGPYSDGGFRHTDGSAENYCRGIVDTVGEGEVIRIDRTPEHFDTVGRNWTDTSTVVHVASATAAAEVRADWERDLLANADTAPAPAGQEEGQAPATAPVTVWATTGSGERINYAHIPNGDPARVAAFLADARAVSHFRDVSTTR